VAMEDGTKPTHVQLQKDLKELRFVSQVAKKYNVTHRCITKWFANYEKYNQQNKIDVPQQEPKKEEKLQIPQPEESKEEPKKKEKLQIPQQEEAKEEPYKPKKKEKLQIPQQEEPKKHPDKPKKKAKLQIPQPEEAEQQVLQSIIPKEDESYDPKKKKCMDCDKLVYKNCTRCLKCMNKNKIKTNAIIMNRPSLEQLKNDLKELKSMVQVGVKYKVSDNAIRKWIKNYEKIS
jgi:hypothetical protein